MHDFAFHFSKISYSKKHPYTLVFKGSCTSSTYDNNEFKFTGADVETTVAIPKEILALLCVELRKDFGNGPFDIKIAREKLKKNGSYYIDYEK